MVLYECFSNPILSISRPASEFIFRFFGDPSAYNASFNALAHLKSTGKIDDELQLGGAFNFDIQPSLSLKVSILFTQSSVLVTMLQYDVNLMQKCLIKLKTASPGFKYKFCEFSDVTLMTD